MSNHPLNSPGVRIINIDKTTRIPPSDSSVAVEPFRTPSRKIIPDSEPVGPLLIQWSESMSETYFRIANAHMVTASYGNNTFVAGYESTQLNNGCVDYSIDGKTWINTTVPNTNIVNDVDFGQDKFMLVGASGTNGNSRLASSVDGINWIHNDVLGELLPRYDRIAYSELLDMWMIMRNVDYRTSTDGVSWSARATFPNTIFGFNPVLYGGPEGFIASNGKDIFKTTDGVNWDVSSFESLPLSGNDVIQTIAVGAGKIVALGRGVSSGQHGIYSTDGGISWTPIEPISTDEPAFFRFRDVKYNNGMFVATGDGAPPSYIMTSEDGINWQIDPNHRFISNRGYKVAYNGDDDRWVVVGFDKITAFGQMVVSLPVPPDLPASPPVIDGVWSSPVINSLATSFSGSSTPLSIDYRRRLVTITYSSDEIEAAVGKIQATVTGMRFDVVGQPLYQPLPDYAIGMKLTFGSSVNIDNSGTNNGIFTLVKEPSPETFTTGETKTFVFDTPFVWVKGYNLTVSWAWGQSPTSNDSSGTLPIGLGYPFHSFTDSAGTYLIDDIAEFQGSHARPVIQLQT